MVKENAHNSQPVSGGREKRLETSHTIRNKVGSFRALTSVIGENSKEKAASFTVMDQNRIKFALPVGKLRLSVKLF